MTNELTGYINKEKVLKYVGQEEIFKYVFGYYPKEGEYVTSPLREDDKNPGCFFEKADNGKIYFRDFVYSTKALDCFDVIGAKYKINNFYHILEFVKKHIYLKQKFSPTFNKQKNVFTINRNKKPFQIYFKPRNFEKKDIFFWKQFKITKKQLEKDLVFSVKSYLLLNTKKGTVKNNTFSNSYAFTEFKSGNIKLYFPHQKGRKRFLTTCKNDDIGNIRNLKGKKNILITKSYKDCRVLRNLQLKDLDFIWFQNEGMYPSKNILLPILNKYLHVIIWFDNDAQGIKASEQLSEYLKEDIKSIQIIYLPKELNEKGISDPSDMIKFNKGEELKQFINKNIYERN